MNRIVNKIVSKYHSCNPIDIAQGTNIKSFIPIWANQYTVFTNTISEE